MMVFRFKWVFRSKYVFRTKPLLRPDYFSSEFFGCIWVLEELGVSDLYWYEKLIFIEEVTAARELEFEWCIVQWNFTSKFNIKNKYKIIIIIFKIIRHFSIFLTLCMFSTFKILYIFLCRTVFLFLNDLFYF